MDNTTRLKILAAQYAGDSPHSIVSGFLAPGASVAIFFIGVIIVIGIIAAVLDHFTENPIEIWKEVQYDDREQKKENKNDVR
ncbi:MAG: hypothetical protein IJH65_11925 [Methanobrevibacter sp.]|nr:hypothetical protein [Methanobrevibacter sp.]